TLNTLLTNLKSWQCSLDQATDYESALAKMRQTKPDICLLNPNLPTRDGFENIDHYFENGTSTSLVLLTGSDSPDPTGIIKAEPVDTLNKEHLNEVTLQNAIQYVLKHKRLQSLIEETVQARTQNLISETKRLQADLMQWQHEAAVRQERAGLYQDLFNVDIYGVEVIDVQGLITDCNATYETMLGYSHDEIVGLPMVDLVADRDKERLQAAFDLVKTQGYAEGEFELMTKDGSTRLIWRRLRATHHGDVFTGAVAYSRDITERMTAVRQISTLARALEQSPAPILITDSEGQIEYINFSFTEMTGYSYEEAVGQDIRLVKSVEQSPDEFKELWETIQAGDEWRGEFHNRRKDGEPYWEALTVAPIFSTQGMITNYIAIQEDITARKQHEDESLDSQRRVGDLMSEHISELTAANERYEREIAERERVESELRRSRARLKAQYKGIPVPTYSWQKSGHDLVLVDYNDIAEKDSQGRIIDFMGKPVREVFKDNEQVVADFEKCLNEKTTVTRVAPYQLITTGEIKHFVTTYNFVPPHLVVVHIQDITKQHRLEEKLKKYEEQAELSFDY
ncbi:MAG: PAS domain S-box protein, partial [Anaerolineae bacterium]|nr:PAS domain S-box protein [Anaerolineae bacterium]